MTTTEHKTRKWAQQVSGNRLTSTHGYNTAGDLETVVYNSGATAGLASRYNRLGKLATVFCDKTRCRETGAESDRTKNRASNEIGLVLR